MNTGIAPAVVRTTLAPTFRGTIMSTTSDGGQLSPCVKLFIELLLQGESGVKSNDIAVVLRPEEAATGPRGWSSSPTEISGEGK